MKTTHLAFIIAAALAARTFAGDGKVGIGVATPAPDLPPALRRAYVQARMQEAGPEYHFAAREGQFLATHPEQPVRFRAGAAGVQIQPVAGDASGWSAEVRLRSLGRDGADAPPAPAALAVRGNRVEYALPGLTEWYLSGPLGLEQGFTLSQRPAGDGPLVLTVGFGDRLEPRLAADGGLELRAGGVTRLRYTDLSAKDADGRTLAARMEVRAGRAALVIEDADARYPIEVDPLLWTEQQKLVASAPAASAQVGISAAVSGDTAVVGTLNSGAYVFVRSGTDWVQQAKLWPTAGTHREFGSSVALSGDTVVVGDRAENIDAKVTYVGAAFVFVRSGTTWTQQQKLLPATRVARARFGASVSVLDDTILVGAWGDKNLASAGTGAAYVFVRSGATWAQQQKLLASDGMDADNFGRGVSLSGDTALVGAPAAAPSSLDHAGAAYVFTRSGAAWSQQAKLVASDAAALDSFGIGVSLSGDTALVGASDADPSSLLSAGAAYVFTRSGAAWSQQAKLVASDAAASDYFGTSVSLSGDTALVGAVNADPSSLTNAGAAYMFTRSGAAWSQQAKLVASDAAASDAFGFSVSLSGDTALVGAVGADLSSLLGPGAAYVFVAPASSYSISGTVTLGGAGLAGVAVSDGTRSDVTAGDGSYTLTGVPNGSYTVTPSLAGDYTFDPASRSVTVAGAAVTGADFAATRPFTLEILSPYGVGTPTAGLYTYALGTVLTNSMANPEPTGGTQYVCTGWSMVGSEPASGTSTRCVMSATNNAALTWLWATNYYLTTAAGPEGSVTVGSGWQPMGVTTQLTAVASPYYHFTAWSGDAAGASNPLELFMDAPKSVTANFAADYTTTHPTPEWWLAQHGITTDFDQNSLADTDHDGFANWQEYVAGTDPTNAVSRLAFYSVAPAFSTNYTETVTFRPATNFVFQGETYSWDDHWVTQRVYAVVGRSVTWQSAAGRHYTLLRAASLTNAFAPVATRIAATPPENAYTDETCGSSAFYKVKVEE